MPGTAYELYSIPSWSTGQPEHLDGSAIGSAKRPVQPGDVLISRINPRINRNWIVGPGEPDRVQIASPEWVCLRPNDRATAQYLYWVAQSAAFRAHVLAAVSSVTGSHARAKPAHIISAPVPVPPVPEQERLAAQLAACMASVDRAHSSIQRADSLSKALLRSLAHAAVRYGAGTASQGELTRDEVLEARAAVGARSTPVPPARLEAGLRAECPLVSLADLSWHIDYGTSTRCTYDGTGSAVLRIPNVVAGRINPADLKFAVDEAVDLGDRKVAAGDLLIVRTNGSLELIGRCAAVTADIDAAFASYLIRFRLLTDLVDPEWTALVLASPYWRRLLESRAASSAGQHNLSIEKLGDVPIPLPAMAQQRAAVTAFQERRRQVELGLAALSQRDIELQRLRNSLLNAALAGELPIPAA